MAGRHSCIADKVQASEIYLRPTGQRANSVVLTGARIGLPHYSRLLARMLRSAA